MYADKSETRIITPDELERNVNAVLDGIDAKKIAISSRVLRRHLLDTMDVMLRVAAQARVAEAKGEPSLLYLNTEDASAHLLSRLLDRVYNLRAG